jgi:hypothetical protein
MPDKNGTAFLVDAMGQETLSEREQKAIRQYLDLPDGPVCEAVEWLLWRASLSPEMDDQEVLLQAMWQYANAGDHSSAVGILARIHTGRKIQDLTEEETEILQDTLTAIRAGGWFPGWLALQVDVIATATHPGDRYPSPLQIASSLTLCIEEEEEKMEAAREMVRMRPDLLGSAAAPPAKSEPPAAVETTQPATKQPAKARRARKPRKKVTRAA